MRLAPQPETLVGDNGSASPSQTNAATSNGTAPPPASTTPPAETHVADTSAAPAAEPVTAPAPPPRELAVQDDRLPGTEARPSPAGDRTAAFEAVMLGADAPTIEVPARQERRSAHLGFRVTDTFLEEFRRRTLLLAVLHNTTVETVNIFVLQELGDCFDRVGARMKAHAETEAKERGR